MTTFLGVVLLVAQVVTGDRSVVSKCEVSTDATYGYTRENPIKVGGTPLYGPARQRRVLQALAGPAGQAIAFRRRGSLAPDAGGIILDLYEITYPGLEKPIELYLDLYRWDPPKAPQGFVCTNAIGLAPPPPDGITFGPPGTPGGRGGPPVAPPAPGPRPPLLTWDRIVKFAHDAGLKEEIQPVPFDPSAPLQYGVAFDPFARVARIARAASAAGLPISPELFEGIRGAETLVVAFPLDCGGRAVTPLGIEVVPDRPAGQTQRVGMVGGVMSGDTLKPLLPAFTAPPGSIGVLIRASILPPGRVQVSYDGPVCDAETPTKTFQILMAPTARPAPAPAPWPEGVEGAPGTTVRVTVHGLIDADGRAIELKVVDGPEPFHAAALAAVQSTNYGANSYNGVISRLPRPFGTTVFFRR